MKAIDHRTLPPTASIRDALEALNQSGRMLTLFIVDEQRRLLGTVTDGDVRRAMLAGRAMDVPVEQAMNRSPRVLLEGEAPTGSIGELKRNGIRLLPLVDRDGRLNRVIDLGDMHSLLPIDALIMAGGRGSRLRPFTDTVPKPLIPVRGKPIIEHALGLLDRHGVENVAISVNYLKERIKSHIGDGSAFGMVVSYLEEDRPLGTAGALGLLPRPKHETILMMNSDLLTDIDLEAMYVRFKEADADLAVATTEHLVELPYAIMDLEGDRVRSFREKPTLAYPCNAGIYLIHRRVLSQLAPNSPYNATDLIKDLLDRGRTVLAFPIDGFWYDIGKHEDLQRAQDQHPN